MTLPVTLADRFRAAWTAFWLDQVVDLIKVAEFVADQARQRAERLDYVLDGLTYNSRRFFCDVEDGGSTGPERHGLNEFMIELSTLPDTQQVTLLRHLLSVRPQLATKPVIHGWMIRNSGVVAMVARRG